MPEALPLVDLVEVAVTRLRAQAAALGVPEDQIAGRLHRGFTAGDVAVRITRVGGSPDAFSYLDRGRLEVESYAATDPQAHSIAALSLVSLLGLRGLTVAGGVVTDVRTDTGPRSLPEPETGAPRYLLGVILYAHPLGS